MAYAAVGQEGMAWVLGVPGTGGREPGVLLLKKGAVVGKTVGGPQCSVHVVERRLADDRCPGSSGRPRDEQSGGC